MKQTQQLLAIMAKLRDPQGGCPWDIEQDFASIAPYTLEEAYEVVDAIERGDMDDLREELGDLLLQVVFHSQMAAEAGLFDFEDVAREVNEKMLRRHPHVDLHHRPRSGLLSYAMGLTRCARLKDSAYWPRFLSNVKNLKRSADSTSAHSLEREPKANSPLREQQASAGTIIKTSTDQIENWESIKQQEKAEKGHQSVLDDVPVGLPAMVRAQKLTKRASRVGFDWSRIEDVFDKLQEEITELREAIAGSPSSPAGEGAVDKIEEELGDLLFVCANLARHLKRDGETALRKANQKFSRRFRHIEEQLAKAQKSWEDSSLEEMEALWQEAKKAE